MSSQARLSFIVVAAAIVLLLFATGLVRLPASRPAKPGVPQRGTQHTPAKTQGLPISQNSPAVSLLLLSYSLNGEVVSVSPTTDGATLVVANQNTSLPPLPITKTTQVVRITPGPEGKQEQASIADIKRGANVNVAAVYNTNTKVWTVHRVNLLPGTTTQSSSPSAR